MNVPNREQERRDWSLVIFIIPLGIILIIIVGQLAVRLFPNWIVNADMRSNLDPNSAPGQPASLLQPLLPQILTPMAWAESYLTPGAGGDISFPPFIILEPTGTPSPTPVSPTPTTVTPTAKTPSPTSTAPYTATPTKDDEETPTEETPTPTEETPTPTEETPTPTEETPTEETPTPTEETPTPTDYPSTPDPSWTLVSPTPDGINTDTPDGGSAGIANGSFIVLDFSGNPIIVLLTPDAYYDLVFYETGYDTGNILLDKIIIGISEYADGRTYYEVFNWGNNIPDNNSNVGDIVSPEEDEEDNQTIPTSELYDPDDTGPAPQTGILIDVDTAPSAPPAGSYNYIVIISPNTGAGDDDDPSQVDAVVVTEVPIPTP